MPRRQVLSSSKAVGSRRVPWTRGTCSDHPPCRGWIDIRSSRRMIVRAASTTPRLAFRTPISRPVRFRAAQVRHSNSSPKSSGSHRLRQELRRLRHLRIARHRQREEPMVSFPDRVERASLSRIPGVSNSERGYHVFSDVGTKLEFVGFNEAVHVRVATDIFSRIGLTRCPSDPYIPSADVATSSLEIRVAIRQFG